ncbi:MAG: hypothetical protein JNK82_43785, partial [Myxococcaceae bacterium]|nr:hypothetical protein [Myxococcaceae bacterium]
SSAWAAAEKSAAARRAAAATALNVDAKLLEAPEMYRAAEAAKAKLNRAEALERARAFAGARAREAQAAAARDFAKKLEAAAEPQRVMRRGALAEAKGKRGAALKAELLAEAPGLRAAKPLKAVRGVLPDKQPLKLEPSKLKPRLKGATGALTPALHELYASVVGEGASVLSDDGELLGVDEVLYGYRAPKTKWALASLASDMSFPLMGALPAPTPDDLAETPETTRTPAVQALVQQLGARPLALYNHVRTTVVPQLYFGSKKGAAATLREKAGNDFDTSSLLVAMLREAGYPARYEHGVVRLSLAQAQALTGATTLEQASFLLSSTGTPSQVDGDTLVAERVWVRAYVPYGDYKGTGAGGESLWVRLDPGMKAVTWKPAISLRGVTTFDSGAYVTAQTQKTPQELFEAGLLAAAKARNLCNNLNDALTAPRLGEVPLELLPAEHPARVLQSLLVFARVPAALSWRASVGMEGAESRSFTIAELQYRSLSLRYTGATAADEALIQAAGGLVNVAPYSVFVRAALKLDGFEEVRFPAVQPGQQQLLTVSISGPNVPRAAMTHRIRAGSVYALSLTAGNVDPAYAEELKALVTTSQTDDNSEAAGRAAAVAYAVRQQADGSRAYQLQGHLPFHDVMESIAGRQVNVTEQFGLPVALSHGLYILDVGRDALTPVPLDGDGSAVASLLELSGFHGSVLEQRAWEAVFANRAIAAVPVLQEATAQGVAVLSLTGAPAAGLSGYTPATMLDVNQALGAGWRVTIPARPVTLPGFIGVEAYVLFNPLTGDGRYIIDTANGGGSNGPGNNPGPPNGPTCCNNNQPVNSTVNLANGRFMERFTDLTLPAIGLPIVFSRHYASDFQQTTSMGTGWLHSYGVFLRTEANGDVIFVTEDTTEVRFVRTDSSFAVPAGWYFTLTTVAGGYRVRAKDGFTWEFDSSGRLTRLADTSGNATTLVYSGAQLVSVNDSSGGAALTLSYTGNKLTQVTDRAGRTVTFGFTGDDLTSATDVLGKAERYGYDARHLMTSRTDKRGEVWRSVFDAFRRWSANLQPDGTGGHATYDVLHLTTVYVDASGAPWRSVHNAAGNPIEHVSPLGETTKSEWTAQERTKSTDGRGFSTVMTYDARGNQLTRTHPDGRVDSTTYDATFSRPLVTTSTGLPTVVNTYDTAGRLKTRNGGLGITTYNYDARGQLDNVVEPGPATTVFHHDAHGSVDVITDATGRATHMGFDSAGHLTHVTDGNGKTRTLEVDAAGRVKAQVDALDRRTEFTYDDSGNRLTVKDAEGALTRYGYDALGRMTAVTDAAGNVTRTEYDADGRVTATVDARGHRSTRKYDEAGRLAESVDASGAVKSTFYCGDVASPCADVDALGHLTTREFDSVGRTTRAVDALGRESTTQYDTGGRVSREAGPGRPVTTYAYSSAGLLSLVSTPALNVSYQYDNRGNRRLVTAGAQATNYTFDLANRLLTETNPLSKVTTFTYDAAGNRRTKLDANGHLTTYSYDDNRRLTRVDFDDGTAYEYDFDSRGNRTLEKGPSHERRLHYDALNRLDVVDDVTFGKQLTYGHDAAGNRTRVSEGGVDHVYEYDSRGLLAAARVGAGPRTVFGYDALGRRSFVARPNGVRTDYVFDDASQLLSMVHAKGGSVLLGFAYGYDGHGNRVSKTREDGTAEVYGYDSSMRLTRVDYGAAKTVEYGLDALGNRTNETQTVRPASGPNVVTTWSATSNAFNQLLTRNRSGGGVPALNATFAYDDNGNTLSESTASPAATTTYSWDRDNRLRTVTPPAPGVPTSYSYDANGLRVQRVDASDAVKYLLDGRDVLSEFDGTGSTTTRYLNNPQGIDDIISFKRGASTYYPLTDGLGSVFAVTDASGAVVRRYDFDVFGVRIDLGGSGPSTDVGYTGRWHDSNGLLEHRDRQRRPELGGWLSPDRVEATNLYAYPRAPTNITDPLGLFPVSPQYAPYLSPRAAIRSAIPALDSVTAYALNNPVAFVALLVALGEMTEEIANKISQAGCDEDNETKEIFFRGDSVPRAHTSLAKGFIAAGVGTAPGQLGAGLYMSRDIYVAQVWASQAYSLYGSGAILQITISTRAWKGILLLGAVDNAQLFASGVQTFVPAGPALVAFDKLSAKVILTQRP